MNQASPNGLVAGNTLAPAQKKELPVLGDKLVLMWHPYSGVGYQFTSGQTPAQEGQQFIEVEVTGIKTAKVLFE